MMWRSSMYTSIVLPYALVCSTTLQIDRDYRRMEAFFLAWASRGGVHAADLDAMIWAAGAQEVRTRRGAPRYRS